jgi:hypothetical protein
MRYSDASVAFALTAWFGLAALLAPVGAQEGAARATTIACTKETTRLDGIGQRVRLTGDCRVVVVSGSSNHVVVERAGSLNVSGMDNEVRWERSLQGEKPRVVNSGIRNVVSRVTPAVDTGRVAGAAPSEKPAAPPPAPPRTAAPTASVEVPAGAGERLVVNQSGQTLRLDCASRPVTVSGSTNTITFTGTCSQVSVTGTGNKITVERTQSIVTTGHNNEVLWQRGESDQRPAVRNSGMNNVVRRVGM